MSTGLATGGGLVHVLVLTATGIRTSDAPFLLAKAFRELGHNATIIANDADLPKGGAIGYRVGGFDDPLYRRAFQRHVRRSVSRLEPDAVLLYGSNWSLEPDTVQYVRRQLGVPVAVWEINQRVFTDSVGSQEACLPLYDHIFCLDSYYVTLLRDMGLGCVEHLCAAADPTEHRPILLDDEDADTYEADISFVGTHHPARAAALASLAEVTDRIRIYGYRWDNVGPPVERWVRNEPVYGRRKTLIYSASRMSLHVRGPHMIHGENFRVFEVAACGRVTVTTPSPDLALCFTIGEEVVVFDTHDDLRRVVAEQLADPTRLAAIGEAAQRRVLREHTYEQRAHVIVDHLYGCSHRGTPSR